MTNVKTLVVGLGNPILGDDGVGWSVAEEVARHLPPSSQEEGAATRVEVECLSLGGLSLMEHLIGYDHAIVIDAIGSGQRPIGSVYRFALDELHDPTAGHTTSAHDVSLMTAIKIGQSMGAHLPDRVTVVAIESPYGYDFCEELTPPVAESVPVATRMVLELLALPSGVS